MSNKARAYWVYQQRQRDVNVMAQESCTTEFVSVCDDRSELSFCEAGNRISVSCCSCRAVFHA